MSPYLVTGFFILTSLLLTIIFFLGFLGDGSALLAPGLAFPFFPEFWASAFLDVVGSSLALEVFFVLLSVDFLPFFVGTASSGCQKKIIMFI